MLDERWVNHRAAMDALSIPGLNEFVREGEVWAPPPVSGQPVAVGF